MGAKVVITTAPSLKYLSYLCLLPLVCWLKTGQAANLLQPTWKTSLKYFSPLHLDSTQSDEIFCLDLDLTGREPESGCRLTAMLTTDILCS